MSDTYVKADSLQYGEGAVSIIFLVLFLAATYFMVLRPQLKRQKEQKHMLDNLSLGDEIITLGGIVGKVLSIEDNFISLQVSAKTQLMVQKQAVVMLLPRGTLSL